MGLPFIGGEPAIKVLASDGVTVTKTVYLPPPNKNGGVQFSFSEVADSVTLIDGSTRKRVKGYLPTLKLTWKVFDDLSPTSRTYGSANGNRVRLQDLLTILATTPGLIRVSPGPAVPGGTQKGFRANVSKFPESKHLVGSLAGEVSVEFVGYAVQATPVLGDF